MNDNCNVLTLYPCCLEYATVQKSSGATALRNGAILYGMTKIDYNCNMNISAVVMISE